MGNKVGNEGRIEGKKRAVGYLQETNKDKAVLETVFNDQGEVVRVDTALKSPRQVTTRGKRLSIRPLTDTERKDTCRVQRIDVSRESKGFSTPASRKASPTISLTASPRTQSKTHSQSFLAKPPHYRLKQRMDRTLPVTTEFTVLSPHHPFLSDVKKLRTVNQKPSRQTSYKLIPVKTESSSLDNSRSSSPSPFIDYLKDKRRHKGVISLSPSKKQVSKSYLSAYIPNINRIGEIHMKTRKQSQAAKITRKAVIRPKPPGSRAEYAWTWIGACGKVEGRI